MTSYLKKIFTLIFITISMISYCQPDSVFIKRTKFIFDSDDMIYTQDTFVFKSPYDRKILIGTSVVRSSKNYNAYNNYGLNLFKVKSSDCDNRESNTENRILNINKTDSLWIVEINIYDNCGYSFLCEIEMADNKTINFIANGYGVNYSCDCCFKLKYYISISAMNKGVEIENFMINGVKTTINPK